MTSRIILLFSALVLLVSASPALVTTELSASVRVMTFNVQDLRPQEIMDDADERVSQAISIIQRANVSVVLINEMAWTQDGRHAARFAQRLGEGTAYTWTYFAAPSNTGEHSGLDLDRNGRIQSEAGNRTYAGDCYGFGEFPGHYAMALFVRSDAAIVWERARTFREVLWKDMPDAMLPTNEDDADSWYTEEALEVFRLSSKSHWDVPVRLSDGRVVHMLCSHPTPPVFDGPEDRNGRRNHDEIRFWLDYVENAPWIVDDAGHVGGLAPDAPFIVMGDLNADPQDGDSTGNPAKQLLSHPRVNGSFAPGSTISGSAGPRGALDPTDTSGFGLRIDYAQPSADLEVLGGGVIRGQDDLGPTTPPLGHYIASDHFPVWVEFALTPSRAGSRAAE